MLPMTNVFLWHRTAVGKTVEAIHTLRRRYEQHPVEPLDIVVAAPRYIHEKWVKELAAHWPEAEGYIYSGTQKKREKIWYEFLGSPADGRFLICTYQMLNEIHLRNPRKVWTARCLDEADMLRNHRTQIYRAVKFTKAHVTFFMTTQPQSQGPQDLYGYLHLADPKNFRSFWRYADRYLIVNEDSFGHKQFAGPRDPVAIRAILAPYLFRRARTDPEVAPHLRSTRDAIYVDMHPEQRALYDELAAECMTIDGSGNVLVTMDGGPKTMRLRQLLVDPRAVGLEVHPAAWDAARDFMRRHREPLVIFSSFPSLFQRLGNYMMEQDPNLDVYVMDANKSTRINDLTVYDFERNESPKKILMCSIKIAKGWDLHTVDTCLFIGPEWDPGLNENAAGRCRGNSASYYVMHRQSVEEDVFYRLDDKTDYRRLTIDPKELAGA